MVALLLVVSGILLFVVAVLGAVRVVAHRINQWADAMICSFGLPPVLEKQQAKCADNPAKRPILATKLNSRFSLRRLAKQVASHILS